MILSKSVKKVSFKLLLSVEDGNRFKSLQNVYQNYFNIYYFHVYIGVYIYHVRKQVDWLN